MEYTLLEKPLTDEQLDATQGAVDVVVAIPFDDVVLYSYEGLVDLLEESITENGILCEITTDKLVGSKDNMVHIHVIATVEDPQ